ncbi:MAG: hypothetical protein AAFR66_22125 [Bacteroidota bacterium]
MKKYLGIILALIGIFIMGLQIGLTAKHESNEYFYLLPVGIAIVIIGIFVNFRMNKKQES